MPLIRTPHTARLLGPEGRRQQAEAMSPLEPLAVVDVGLGAVGSTLHLAGIDPQHREAFVLSQVVERDPVHARRCHGHRRHLALPQPGDESIQVGGEGPEAAHVQGQDSGRARGYIAP
jgi:hypothetical protein